MLDYHSRYSFILVFVAVLCVDNTPFQAHGQPLSPPTNRPYHQHRDLEKDLRDAAKKGDTATVEKMLEQGAEVDSRDKDGRTALWLAAEKGNTDTVQLLLSRGADPNLSDKDGKNALFVAVEKGHFSVAKTLPKGIRKRVVLVTQRGFFDESMFCIGDLFTGGKRKLFRILAELDPGQLIRDAFMAYVRASSEDRFDVLVSEQADLAWHSPHLDRSGTWKVMREILTREGMDADTDTLLLIYGTPSVICNDPMSDSYIYQFPMGARLFRLKDGKLLSDTKHGTSIFNPRNQRVVTLSGSPDVYKQQTKDLIEGRLDEIYWTIVMHLSVVQGGSEATAQNEQPKTAEEHFYRGLAHSDKGDYDQAIQDYSQAISLNPNYAEAYNNRGVAYFEKDEYDRAIQDYNQAISLNPNYAEAYINHGIAHTQKGDYDHAIQDYGQAISLNPNYAEAYNNRGVAYFEKRDYDRAIQDYSQAISLNPNYAEAYSNRGVVYHKKGDLEHAIQDEKKLLTLGGLVQPKRAVEYVIRGVGNIEKDDYDRAIQDYNQAISLNARYDVAYNLRGNAFYKKGDLEHAIQDYSQAIELDPNFASAYQNRAEAYRKLGKKNLADADEKKAKLLGRQER